MCRSAFSWYVNECSALLHSRPCASLSIRLVSMPHRRSSPGLSLSDLKYFLSLFTRSSDAAHRTACKSTGNDRLLFQGTVDTLDLPCLPFTADEVCGVTTDASISSRGNQECFHSSTQWHVKTLSDYRRTSTESTVCSIAYSNPRRS